MLEMVAGARGDDDKLDKSIGQEVGMDTVGASAKLAHNTVAAILDRIADGHHLEPVRVMGEFGDMHAETGPSQSDYADADRPAGVVVHASTCMKISRVENQARLI